MEDINKILLDFIDGDISEKGEKDLFNRLSMDENLQSRFKKLMQIENAVTNKSNAFIPPASVTMGVFDQLGFKPSRTSFSDKVIGNVSSFFVNYKQAIISALVTAGIASLLYFGFGTSNTSDQLSSQNQIAELNREPIEINLNAPISREEKVIFKNEASSNNSQIFASNLTNKQSDMIDILDPNKDEISYMPFTNKEIVKTSFTTPFNTGISRISPTDLASNSMQYPIASFSEDNKWSIEFLVAPGFALNNPTVEPEFKNPATNLGINLDYRAGQTYSFGLGLKQETYFQSFTGIDEFGRNIQFEQQPNFTLLETYARYYYPLWDNFDILGQIGVGGDIINQSAFSSRFRLGGKFEIKGHGYLVGGFEYSNIMYGNMDLSNKAGLFLGFKAYSF